MLTLKTEFIIQDERIDFLHFKIMGCLPVRELSRVWLGWRFVSIALTQLLISNASLFTWYSGIKTRERELTAFKDNIEPSFQKTGDDAVD